jgi:hypothetical protein
MKAKEVVIDLDHTMQIEAQGVGNLQQKIKEIAQDLARNSTLKLWDYNYIPGQTPLDESEKSDLLPSIVTREDLDAFEQESTLEART